MILRIIIFRAHAMILLLIRSWLLTAAASAWNFNEHFYNNIWIKRNIEFHTWSTKGNKNKSESFFNRMTHKIDWKGIVQLPEIVLEVIWFEVTDPDILKIETDTKVTYNLIIWKSKQRLALGNWKSSKLSSYIKVIKSYLYFQSQI